MARLIDVSALQPMPAAIALRKGDLLIVRATGGCVVEGSAFMEQLGAFAAAALAPDGRVLDAMGSPDAVAFLARDVGRAKLKLMRGDPWRGESEAATMLVMVAD
jgi:hypothetical protein